MAPVAWQRSASPRSPSLRLLSLSFSFSLCFLSLTPYLWVQSLSPSLWSSWSFLPSLFRTPRKFPLTLWGGWVLADVIRFNEKREGRRVAARLEKVVAQEVSLLSRYVAEEGHCQRMAKGFPRFSLTISRQPSSFFFTRAAFYDESVLAYTYALSKSFALGFTLA